MKTLTFIFCLLSFAFSAGATTVNDEVLKIFAKTYPEAQGTTWEDMKEGYRVFFTKNNISYRLQYDQQGNVTLALKYYTEENLPPLILNKVKKAYADYKIYSVIEESTDIALTYHVVLEDAKHILNIKSDPTGFLEVESKYNKG